jgi:hypothetical protein
MLFFAVRRRSAVDEATGPRNPMGKRGPVALWSPKPPLPYCFFTVCGGLAWVATPTGNIESAVRRCSTFVRIKRGFGYTQDPKTEDPTFVIYDFRHTFATRMAKGGCDIATLAKILGHGNLRSVQKYIHIDEEHVKLAMQRYGHWPAGTPNAHKSLPSGPAAMQ